MKRRTLFSLAAIAVLVVGGWIAVPTLVRAHVDGLIQASVGKPLPAFVLRDTAGREWSTDALKGKRVVLHFFRSRCHSCDVEAPAIRELEQRLPADVELLHVMTDAVLEFPAELTAQTIEAKKFARPVLLADAKFVDAFHHVNWSNVTPITYVVDARGTVAYGLRGSQTVASIETALAAAK
jgi:peroxiredoxin